MARMRGVIAFTALRLLLFAVPFGVVWVLGRNVVIAAIVAAIVGVCLSVIFLPRQRAAMAGAIGDRVERRRADPRVVTDEDVEDAAVGGAPDQGSSASAAASPRP